MNKLYISNLLFILAESLRTPYRPYQQASILVDWETVDNNYIPFNEIPPSILAATLPIFNWLWKNSKDRTHYTSLTRFLRTHSASFTLIEWQYMVHLFTTYYGNNTNHN